MSCPNARDWIGLGLLLAALASPLRLLGAVQGEVGHEFFERRIRPLLLEHCVSCHGPEKQKGHLRLDSPEAIRAGGDGGAVIEPGDAAKSRMIQAVAYQDPDLKMPPKQRLSESQVGELTRWVQSGAVMPTNSTGAAVATLRKEFQITDKDRHHWAFQPIKRPALPLGAGVGLHPIDAFVDSGLQGRGLKANPRASRHELIRRATFDLIGLPPSPEEVEAFVNDTSPRAWDALIDRLLASPHYGEKWGRHWLDLVRFAESNSYERDGAKPHAWRYRDYVIRSLNADKPYDRFLQEQLAGDELPEPDADAIVATGFYRLGIWDDEPADRELARYDALDDIVATTGQTLLGLTVDCARCHHHKIDPISQHDYYRFVSFFQNINHYRNGGPTDEIPIFQTEQQKQAHLQKKQEIDSRRKVLQKGLTDTETLFRRLYDQRGLAISSDLEGLHYQFYRDTWETLPDFTQIKFEDAGRLTNGLVDLKPRTRDTSIGFVFEGMLVVPQDGAYTFYLDSDDGARLSLDGRPVIHYDGIHTLGNPQQAGLQLRQGRVAFRLDYFQKVEKLGLTLAWSGPGFDRRSLSAPHNAKTLPPARAFAELMKEKGEGVLGKEEWGGYLKTRAQLEALNQSEPKADLALGVTEAGASAPETFVLGRGNPNLKGERVEPGFLQVLGSAQPVRVPSAPGGKSSGRRTALARWITANDNPLTARVMVNRLWQYHFGRGIVRSPNNFGTQGDRPTHPELLDWLASEFLAQGWSLKAMHRLMMSSEAYQRSSAGREEALVKDPMNNGYWRFDMRRLTAEEIRDSILSLTGVLNSKMFGPGVYVEIPKEVKAGQSQPGSGWGKSPPEEQSRRSIYIHVKRSLITPILESFDVAETDRSAPVRFTTVQPTQALGMLNGAFLNQQAGILATRLQKEYKDDLPRQIRESLYRATSRPPSEQDVKSGIDLVASLVSEDQVSHETALRYFCLLVLNLNEMVFLD